MSFPLFVDLNLVLMWGESDPAVLTGTNHFLRSIGTIDLL